jgi:hypothetical protein
MLNQYDTSIQAGAILLHESPVISRSLPFNPQTLPNDYDMNRPTPVGEE